MRRRAGFTLLELLIVLAIVSILWAMLFPVFARARESARKIHCLSGIVQLGVALHLYAADWSGAFPPKDDDWDPLDPYVRNRDVFRCPDDSKLAAAPTRTEAGKGQPVHIESSYIYRSGLSNDGRAAEIVAFDRWIWHLGGRNVVFLDGHGSWFSAATFWIVAPPRVIALDPAFHALNPAQQKAAREGEEIRGRLPWK
jgi:prepilin-type N-terminal cleavage/methylation domain-containing protein/prepilin-type processing-associated H-X9-DG protein